MGIKDKIKRITGFRRGGFGIKYFSTPFGEFITRADYMSAANTLRDLQLFGFQPTPEDKKLMRKPWWPLVRSKRLKPVAARINAIDPKGLEAPAEFHARQLEILEKALEVIRHLQEADLHPFVNSGTLLGAVRHGGMVPWDDDVDVNVMRDEFHPALRILAERYKYVDAGDVRSWKEYYNRLNGMFERGEVPQEGLLYYALGRLKLFFSATAKEAIQIDIAVMDYYSDDADAERFEKDRQAYVAWMTEAAGWKWKSNWMERSSKWQWKDIDAGVEEWVAKGKCAVPHSNTVYFGMQHFYYWGKFRGFMKKSDFFPLRTLKLEGYDVPVPNHPEVILRTTYGDNYMSLPLCLTLDRHGFVAK